MKQKDSNKRSVWPLCMVDTETKHFLASCLFRIHCPYWYSFYLSIQTKYSKHLWVHSARGFISAFKGLTLSVQFSHLTVSDCLRPRELQHARPPCPSPTPGVYPNSCPLSQWNHPTISSSVIPFSSCPQFLPASGSFQMSQFFPSGGQSIGVSASVSLFPINIQNWFPLGLTCWISLQSKGLARVFSNTTVQKHQFFGAHLSL